MIRYQQSSSSSSSAMRLVIAMVLLCCCWNAAAFVGSLPHYGAVLSPSTTRTKETPIMAGPAQQRRRRVSTLFSAAGNHQKENHSYPQNKEDDSSTDDNTSAAQSTVTTSRTINNFSHRKPIMEATLQSREAQSLQSYPSERFPLLYSLASPERLDSLEQSQSSLTVAQGIQKHHADTEDNNLVESPSSSSFSLFLLNLTTTFLVAYALVTLLNQALLEWEWMQAWRYTWPLLGLVYMYQGGYGMIRMMTTTKTRHDSSNLALSLFSSLSSWLPASTIAILQEAIVSFLPLPPPTTIAPAATGFARGYPYHLIPLLAGAGLVIGGAADAFLPAYVTGPNLVTAAGLAPDSAVILALWQLRIMLFTGTNNTNNHNNNIAGKSNGNCMYAPATNSNSSSSSSNTLVQAMILAQLYILGAGSVDDVASQTTAVLAAAATMTTTF